MRAEGVAQGSCPLCPHPKGRPRPVFLGHRDPALPCPPPTAAHGHLCPLPPSPALQDLPPGQEPCSPFGDSTQVAAKQELMVRFTEERARDPVKGRSPAQPPPDLGSGSPRGSPWGGPGYLMWSRCGHYPSPSSPRAPEAGGHLSRAWPGWAVGAGATACTPG